MATFNYKVYKGRRVGVIKTKHGDIRTPGFVSCATYGNLKGANIWDYNGDLLLVNALHCYPIKDTVKKAGGIHKFIGYNGPVISDSGGFQIFSLGVGSVSNEIKGIKQTKKNFIKVYKDKFTLQNPKNGIKYDFNPEISIQTQIDLGVDFVVAFDECSSANISKREMKKSMDKSHRWEQKSLDYFNNNKLDYQEMYGIVQGGTYEDLRLESIDFVNKRNFFGVAIGGSLGKTKEEMYKVLAFVAPKIDPARPIHTLGIGYLEDIRQCAGRYGDTFDCVHPTRIARHGIAILPQGNINLNNAKYKEDFEKLDPTCECITCKTYSKAHLRHLIKNKQIPGHNALTIHNISIMQRFMSQLRDAIENDKLDDFDMFWFGKKFID